MTQAQVDARADLNNMYFIDVDPNLRVKIWKKGKEGVRVTLIKTGTAQCMTISLEAFRTLIEARDMLLLASDFLRGLVGYTADKDDESKEEMVNAELL